MLQRVVASRPTANAYRVSRDRGAVREELMPLDRLVSCRR